MKKSAIYWMEEAQSHRHNKTRDPLDSYASPKSWQIDRKKEKEEIQNFCNFPETGAVCLNSFLNSFLSFLKNPFFFCNIKATK